MGNTLLAQEIWELLLHEKWERDRSFSRFFLHSLSLSLSLTLCYEWRMVQDFVFENCR